MAHITKAQMEHVNISFDTISMKVNRICSTEKTTGITLDNYNSTEIKDYICNRDNFSEFGFASMGRMVGFPSPFLNTLADENPTLAKTVVADRVSSHFMGDNPTFFTREFEGKICGVVSNKYNYFDDNQAIDIIGNSMLADRVYTDAMVTPERLHLRAIDENRPFRVHGDDSDLFFCYFIDNSMVGQSSFKVSIGLYRLACTNGLIVPMKEMIICKQVHRGGKDIVAEFNHNIELLNSKTDSIKAMITDLATKKSKINTMSDLEKESYLARQLNLSAKETKRLLDIYTDTYGGETQWHLVNAVTEFARDVNNIDRREFLERKVLKMVA